MRVRAALFRTALLLLVVVALAHAVAALRALVPDQSADRLASDCVLSCTPPAPPGSTLPAGTPLLIETTPCVLDAEVYAKRDDLPAATFIVTVAVKGGFEFAFPPAWAGHGVTVDIVVHGEDESAQCLTQAAYTIAP